MKLQKNRPELEGVQVFRLDVSFVGQLGGHRAQVGAPLGLVLVAGGLDDAAVYGVAVSVLLQLVQDLGPQLSMLRLGVEQG